MLFAMPEEVYLADLAARLPAEAKPESQRSTLLALWYTATPLGRRTIRHCADDEAMPAATRAYAKQLLARSMPAVFSLSFSSEAALRKERVAMMRRPISDESLGQFDWLTAKLRPDKAD
jgi:hypothetical protein